MSFRAKAKNLIKMNLVKEKHQSMLVILSVSEESYKRNLVREKPQSMLVIQSESEEFCKSNLIKKNLEKRKKYICYSERKRRILLEI